MACKEDDPQPAYEYQTQGFIKGTLTGKSRDNAYTFNEDFNYTQYNLSLGSALYTGLSTYKINDNGTYTLQLSRANFASNSVGSMSFELDTPTDTTPSFLNIGFIYYRELNDKVVSFSMVSDAANTSTLTDFKFDLTTGRCTGKFTLTGIQNSTGKNATITGDIDLVAKRFIR